MSQDWEFDPPIVWKEFVALLKQKDSPQTINIDTEGATRPGAPGPFHENYRGFLHLILEPKIGVSAYISDNGIMLSRSGQQDESVLLQRIADLTGRKIVSHGDAPVVPFAGPPHPGAVEVQCPRMAEAPRSFRVHDRKFYVLSNGKCGYCNSLMQDEFMALLEAGTIQLGATDKNYKVYVHGHPKLSFCKFYFQHLTEDQKKRFVVLLNERKIKFQGDIAFYILPFFMERPDTGA